MIVLRMFTRRSGMKEAVERLEEHTVSAELQERLATFLQDAPDRAVFHFNPRYLAEQVNLDERATLKLLLAALYEGIVTLHWDVRCPACGAVDHRSTSLSHLHHDVQCEACLTHFAPKLDEEVRVTFSPHVRLRPLPASADDLPFRAAIDARLGPTPGLAMLTLPEFRRLFPQQRLLPDESLDVTRVALLFTDLAGSTALYARQGDPRAYHLVRLHFDELFRVTDALAGAIVKTIGDAILAAFQTPAEAVRAAIAMQQTIAELNVRQQLPDHEQLILKVGVHSGPCLSVTLNDNPDYFGTAVNIAARVQGLSHGNDIVVTEAIRTDPDAQILLEPYDLESQHAVLKGIDTHFLVHRLKILTKE